ncbi:hypothetical protein N836_26805 [Leptolyngbya sp. Heron Island J]|nr:hypothetical protein N836_26805 [Leptolyngbya sp. Heron Island J]
MSQNKNRNHCNVLETTQRSNHQETLNQPFISSSDQHARFYLRAYQKDELTTEYLV